VGMERNQAASKSKPGATGVLPVGRRRTLYGLALGTWITGCVWLLFYYFVRVEDQFGFENPHPQQRLWLIAHAIFSLGAVWIFGALWSDHVVRGWKAKLRRNSGGWLFVLTAWLALSGCALYYIGSDVWREWMSLGHWVVGVAAIIFFLVHFRKQKKRAE
jgi:hypothetical protein